MSEIHSVSNTDVSPIIDADSSDNKDTKTTKGGGNSYTILLALIIVILVLFLMYHAYSCFCTNQNSIEPYINESPRTDTQDDKPFDVGYEVKKLIQLQETYLEKLQRSRLGNG